MNTNDGGMFQSFLSCNINLLGTVLLHYDLLCINPPLAYSEEQKYGEVEGNNKPEHYVSNVDDATWCYWHSEDWNIIK